MNKCFIRWVLGISVLFLMGEAHAQASDSGKHQWCTHAALEARMDYDYRHFPEGDEDKGAFQGRYLNFQLDGMLASRLSYHYRQRINAGNMGFSTTFFEGTDWLYMDWQFASRFSVSAGKEVVAIGGWEYDLAPINMYYWSEFWNNVNCYEMGVSLHYRDEHNHWQLQLGNSPYVTQNLQHLYALNLIWYGDYNWFKPIYSTNLVEYERGSFIHYVALGNKFDFGKAYVYVDVMNRATDKQSSYFFEDYSVMVEAKAYLGNRWTLFAKGGCDENSTEIPSLGMAPDQYVLPGTQYVYAGLGGEFFPLLGKNTVRIHAFAAYKDDRLHSVKTLEANAGLTWHLGIK